MFKKFTIDQNVSSSSQVKNSVQRAVRSDLVDQYPFLEQIIDDIMPKKLMVIAKCSDHVQLIVVNNEILFFRQDNGHYFPTLRLLHKYPDIMPKMQVDKGAIRFVLGGANIMSPGFTSPGGSLPVEIDANKPVAIYAEGKVHALAVGITKMSTNDIKSINKGIAVDNVHSLLDGLWQNGRLN